MRSVAAFATLAALAACASAPPAASTGPLRAELTEDEFGARVHLSAPAYVALFHITPGQGAFLVYPRDQADRPQVRAGSTLLVSRRERRGAVALSGGLRSDAAYLYLVASKEPLEVEQFQQGTRSVRDVIGSENDASQDLEVIMRSLDVALMSTDATVAGPWTSDVLTPWERLAVRGRVGENARNPGRSDLGCNGVWASGTCRGIAPTPTERRNSRPNAGDGSRGGGAGGGGGGSKPGGTGSTRNN